LSGALLKVREVGAQFPDRAQLVCSPASVLKHNRNIKITPPGLRPAGTPSATAIMPPVAYDEDLADRIRALVLGEPDITEKAMFGGLAFLIGGNMSVAASGEGGLLLRVDPDETDALVQEPYAQAAEMRGRVMRGWLRIAAEGLSSPRELERWVARGTAYARSLPKKR
jgi:TfoX/Sxy family transcriptional regulator of competence genes